ncbi:MAG: UTP--glucose-1-phosphate uridylyltransferase [Candidatus Babeliaceae bacterium]|nr:UTP--glucose-1-phosphate uridylyltransferase [Candidatus Babeliaceae bacterium]
MDIHKIVIPAAGLGSRFLPYSKSVPKEMLPIFHKPLIQYAIEESIASNLYNFFIITNKSKKLLADYLDTAPDLEAILKERSQEQLLVSTDRLARLGSYAYIRQQEPQGLGHALLLMQSYISKEHFCVALPDDLIVSPDPLLQQLIRIARQEKACVLAVQEVPNSLLGENTVINIKKSISRELFQVGSLSHQPTPKDAPSNLAVVGRYVLSPKIFPALEYLNTHLEGHELPLHAAISQMAQDSERVFAYKFTGTCFHIDTPLNWLRALVALGLQNPQYAQHISEIINETRATPTAWFNKRGSTEIMDY